MKTVLLSFAMLIGLALPGRADEAAIRTVISSQIQAFLADDLETAFSHASPSIRSRFGTPEGFGRMVREGYPMVWRPDEVTFLTVETIGGALWQNVLIRDAAGALHVLQYQMIEAEGGWKINAVRVTTPPDGTA